MSRKTDDPRFRRSRARKGGRSRAARYSPLWQQLMMYFLTEKRARRTTISRFSDWLVQHGLDRVAAEARTGAEAGQPGQPGQPGHRRR